MAADFGAPDFRREVAVCVDTSAEVTQIHVWIAQRQPWRAELAMKSYMTVT